MANAPDIGAFYQRATATRGEFRISTEAPDELQISRHRGGFAGRVVRWVRSKLTRRTRNTKYADAVRAAQAFEQALRSYYGDSATQRLIRQGQFDPQKPLESSKVRRIIRETNAQHTEYLDAIIASANQRPTDGLELLANLAARSLMDSKGARAILQKADLPAGSSVDIARNLFLRNPDLASDKIVAFYSAIDTAELGGSVQELYGDLYDNDLLTDPDSVRLLQTIPNKIKSPQQQHLLHLAASGFFVALTTPPPSALVPKGQAYLFAHQTENLPKTMPAFNKEMQAQLNDIAFGTNKSSLSTGQVEAFCTQSGQLELDRFLQQMPKETQFALDFPRDIATNTSYEIDGKNYVRQPRQALEALWNICDGEPQQFAGLCNLLSQTSWGPFYSSNIRNLIGQRDENYLSTLSGEKTAQRHYKVERLAPRTLGIKLINETGGANVKFTAVDTRGESYHFTCKNGASMHKYQSLDLALTRTNVVFSGASSYAALEGLTENFQTQELY